MNALDDNLKNRAGGFRLEPRKEVWERVEQELNSKKRKRRLVWFWWFAPLLLAGGAVWFSQNPSKESGKVVAHGQASIHPSLAEIEPTPAKEKETNLASNDRKEISGTSSRSINNSNTPHATPITTPSSGKGAVNTNRPPEDVFFQPGQQTPPVAKTQVLTTEDNAMVVTSGNEAKEKRAENTLDSAAFPVQNIENQIVVVPSEPQSDTAKSTEALAVLPQGEITPVKDSQIVAVVQPVALKKDKKASKGTWYGMAGAGIHNHTGKGITLEKSMADYNGGGLNNNAGGGQSSTSTSLVSPEPGLGLMLGIERSQPFGKSKHWSWVGGLHYQYQSFKISTGTLKDSALNYSTDRGNVTAANYYRAGNSDQQKGSQHRVHLLAAIQWHLDKKQHWTWQNGLYGGIVLSSDYLIPQTFPRGWVPSKGLTQTGYAGIETGFIFRPSKWGAGIFGQYNLSNSLNITGPAPQYWRGIELRIQYNLSSNSLNK